MISITKLFSQTLHEAPADAETRGYQLLLRAGYISHLGSGFFSLLPPAKRILDKTIQFLAQLLEESGSLEIDMPSLSPNTNIQSISVMATRNQLLISRVHPLSSPVARNRALHLQGMERESPSKNRFAGRQGNDLFSLILFGSQRRGTPLPGAADGSGHQSLF